MTLKRSNDLARRAEDWAGGPVPPADRRPTLSIMAARMGFTVSGTDLLYGVALGLYLSFWTATLVALLSSMVICVVSVLTGLIGQRHGVTTALYAERVFGRHGSKVPTLIFALVLTGFAGYGTAITATVLPTFGVFSAVHYCFLLGAMYTVICVVGFRRGLTWVGYLSVPSMVVLIVIAAVIAIDHAGGIGGVVAAVPAEAGAVPITTLVGLGVIKWMVGATVTPDVTRFAKSESAVWWTTLGEFILGNFGFNLLGIILGLGVGTGDLGAVFLAIGLATMGALVVFVQGFPHEVNNMYAASLSARIGLGVPRIATALGAGAIAVGLGLYGVTHDLLEAFLGYLNLLGYVTPLVAGVLIADYYLVKRSIYDSRANVPAVNWPAALALLIGVGANLYLGLVLEDVLWRSLPLIGAASYVAVSLIHRRLLRPRYDQGDEQQEERVPARG